MGYIHGSSMLPCRSLLQPIFRYPLSYMSYHTFSFIGFMRNEVSGWSDPARCPAKHAEQNNACA